MNQVAEDHRALPTLRRRGAVRDRVCGACEPLPLMEVRWTRHLITAVLISLIPAVLVLLCRTSTAAAPQWLRWRMASTSSSSFSPPPRASFWAQLAADQPRTTEQALESPDVSGDDDRHNGGGEEGRERVWVSSRLGLCRNPCEGEPALIPRRALGSQVLITQADRAARDGDVVIQVRRPAHRRRGRPVGELDPERHGHIGHGDPGKAGRFGCRRSRWFRAPLRHGCRRCRRCAMPRHPS